MLKKIFLILFLTHTLYALDNQNIEIPKFGWSVFWYEEMLKQADSKEVFKSKTHTLESLIDILLFDRPRDGRTDFDVVIWSLVELEIDYLIKTDIEDLKHSAIQCKTTNRECLLHKGSYLTKIFQHTSLTCDSQYLDSNNEKYAILHKNLYEFVDYILYNIPYRSTNCKLTSNVEIEECHYLPTITYVMQFYALKTKEKCFK